MMAYKNQKVLKVRIVNNTKPAGLPQSGLWYENKVGEEFEVYDWLGCLPPNYGSIPYYPLKEDIDKGGSARTIFECNCIVLGESKKNSGVEILNSQTGLFI